MVRNQRYFHHLLLLPFSLPLVLRFLLFRLLLVAFGLVLFLFLVLLLVLFRFFFEFLLFASFLHLAFSAFHFPVSTTVLYVLCSLCLVEREEGLAGENAGVGEWRRVPTEQFQAARLKLHVQNRQRA